MPDYQPPGVYVMEVNGYPRAIEGVSATTTSLLGRDAVEKLKRLPIAHPPEWTDNNESDPGVALLELFAWLTEELLKRANQIPEAGAVHASRLAVAALDLVKDLPPSDRRAIKLIKFIEGAEVGTPPFRFNEAFQGWHDTRTGVLPRRTGSPMTYACGLRGWSESRLLFKSDF